MKLRIFAVISVVAAFGLGMALTPFSFATVATGQVNYYTSSGTCTSTWNGATGHDGSVTGLFPNNVGGPPVTAIVGTGSICINVVLTGATPNTVYTITSNKLSGTLTITTDGTGDGSGTALFTSTYSGACTTVALTMSPETPYSLSGGQINHVFVGTGTTTSGDYTINCGGTSSVPEFPLGPLLIIGLALPLMLVLRKFAIPRRL